MIARLGYVDTLLGFRPNNMRLCQGLSALYLGRLLLRLLVRAFYLYSLIGARKVDVYQSRVRLIEE